MKFLIEKDPDMFPEVDLIKHTMKYTSNTYEEIKLKDFKYRISNPQTNRFDTHIPIGSIQFVELWLKTYKNIDKMQPIEIPPILRTEEFLKRDYKFIVKHQLPKTGKYFIKNIDRLKTGTFVGDMTKWWIAYSTDFGHNDMFAVSSIVDIQSEWRVYVIDEKIDKVVNYDGNPTIFPDMILVQRAIDLFISTGQAPKSFTIDVAISDEGTFILELHPFTSIGLYSTIWDSNLVKAYKDGIDWYINTDYKL